MANDFSGDSACKGSWNFESGNVLTDTKGSNNLTAPNSYAENAVTYKQGSQSIDLELDTQQYLERADADLDSGFPLKTGETQRTFSFCVWMRCESVIKWSSLAGKYRVATNGRSFNIAKDTSAKLRLYNGYNSGNSYESGAVFSDALTIGRWYHVGVTFDGDDDKAWRIRVWDDTASDFLDGDGEGNDLTGTFAQTTYISAQAFRIGGYYSSVYVTHDGELDEAVIFDDILTTNEIDQIRAGTYGAGGEELEKSLSDTINLSDGYIASFGLPEADSISLSDGIAKNVGLPEADTISLSDGITKTPGLSKSDTISLSDDASRVVAFLRTLNDSISLSDGLVKNFGTTKTDTISMSDNLVSAVISIILKLNDTITLSDEISKVTSFLRSLSDAVTVSDGITKSTALSKADTIDVSDTRSVGYGLNKEDSISLADLITKAPGLSIADTINLSDEKALNTGLSKADTISLSDDISKAAAFLRSLSDIISLSDSISKGIIRIAVTPDGRIIIVPGESRAMVVESENRTVTVSAENRTITIGT